MSPVSLRTRLHLFGGALMGGSKAMERREGGGGRGRLWRRWRLLRVAGWALWAWEGGPSRRLEWWRGRPVCAGCL